MISKNVAEIREEDAMISGNHCQDGIGLKYIYKLLPVEITAENHRNALIGRDGVSVGCGKCSKELGVVKKSAKKKRTTTTTRSSKKKK